MAEIEKKADQAEAANIRDSENAKKDGGVIAGQADQKVHGKAFEQTHKGDKTLSEPDMIAMNDGETVAQYKARVAEIQANRFGFFDSQEESKSPAGEIKSIAAETGTVIEYQHEKIGDNFYASGIGYVDDSPARSTFDKLTDFCESAAARALDADARKAYIQGQLDKLIGIGEGLDIAKDGTKAAAVAGWVALTDGTVANFLARPNAVNEPLFHAVCGALDAMAKDPNAVNHALEQVGAFVVRASERYTDASNREKGQIIGETMFGMVNPEGSPEAAEAALKLAGSAAKHVDGAVAKLVLKGYRTAEDQIQAFPKQAESIRKLLYDRLMQFELTPQQLEYAGIPRNYFEGIRPASDVGKTDNLLAMSKADEPAESMPKQAKGELAMKSKAGAGGDWPVINERVSADVVIQKDSMSCVSAVGEMLTNGEFKQSDLMRQLGGPCDIRDLANVLGFPWKGAGVPAEELDRLMKNGPWAAELRVPVTLKYRRLEPGHAVVVDGFDEHGNLMIRDPAEGTSYEMTRKDFLDYWSYHSVFRR